MATILELEKRDTAGVPVNGRLPKRVADFPYGTRDTVRGESKKIDLREWKVVRTVLSASQFAERHIRGILLTTVCIGIFGLIAIDAGMDGTLSPGASVDGETHTAVVTSTPTQTHELEISGGTLIVGLPLSAFERIRDDEGYIAAKVYQEGQKDSWNELLGVEEVQYGPYPVPGISSPLSLTQITLNEIAVSTIPNPNADNCNDACRAAGN